VTALFAIVPLYFIVVPQPEKDGETERAGLRSTWRDVLAGVRYLRSRTGHMPLLMMAAVINLCMVPAFALLPLLVVEQGGGAGRLGGLNSLFGVGTIAGGILLGVWGGFKPRVYTTFVGLMVAGVGTLLLGGAGSVGMALVGMGILGLTMPMVNGPIQAVLQATVAPEYQGRVFTLYGSLCGIMMPFGLAIAAPVADLVGVRTWYAADGLACLAMGALGFLLPSIVRIEDRASAAETGDTADAAA